MARQEIQFADRQLFVLCGVESAVYYFAVDLHGGGLVRRAKIVACAKAECVKAVDAAVGGGQLGHAELV